MFYPMHTFRLLILLLLALFQTVHVYSQVAKNTLKNAEAAMRAEEYRTAAPLWRTVLESDPENLNANFQLGICYLRIGRGGDAYSHLIKAKEGYGADMDPRINLLIGESLHMAAKWDDAITSYSSYLDALPKSGEAERPEIIKYIAECQRGKIYAANPTKAQIDNLGKIVNSRFPEYTPVITADNSTMFFTSRRENSTGGDKAENDQYYEDIYMTTRRGADYSMPVNIGDPVNSKFHDAAIALSPNGAQLFLYKDEEQGNIYFSTRKGKTWTKPKSIGKTINTKLYKETSVSITADGRILYFSSDRPGGSGGLDIYMCKRLRNDWGEAVNLGSTINTPDDDDSPFIHPDGVTLYFSSKGHDGIGGYDIYTSSLVNDNWTVPENLQLPINTPGNDIYFVLSADSRTGYYASEKSGGEGFTDIYRITMPNNEDITDAQARNTTKVTGADSTGGALNAARLVNTVAAPVRAASNVILVKGVISDATSKQPISAQVVVVDNATGETVSEAESNESTGEYLVVLPANKNYGVSVNATGYLFHSENFYLPENKGYKEFNKDIPMNRATAGTRVVLRNIFFDTNKSTLRNESKNELEKLLKLMKEMETLKLEIAGHTDNVGNADYNKKLSKDRADAVVKYLLEKGVPKDRLTAAGYGFDRPMAANDNETNRQLNRRTEFEVK